jgi:hypothetical protein
VSLVHAAFQLPAKIGLPEVAELELKAKWRAVAEDDLEDAKQSERTFAAMSGAEREDGDSAYRTIDACLAVIKPGVRPIAGPEMADAVFRAIQDHLKEKIASTPFSIALLKSFSVKNFETGKAKMTLTFSLVFSLTTVRVDMMREFDLFPHVVQDRVLLALSLRRLTMSGLNDQTDQADQADQP